MRAQFIVIIWISSSEWEATVLLPVIIICNFRDRKFALLSSRRILCNKRHERRETRIRLYCDLIRHWSVWRKRFTKKLTEHFSCHQFENYINLVSACVPSPSVSKYGCRGIDRLIVFDLIMDTIPSKRSIRPRCHFTNSRRSDLAKRSCPSTYSTFDVGVFCLHSANYTPLIRFEVLLLCISPPTCARHILWFPNAMRQLYANTSEPDHRRCFSATRFTATATASLCLRP